jgi:hypothetical protein
MLKAVRAIKERGKTNIRIFQRLSQVVAASSRLAKRWRVGARNGCESDLYDEAVPQKGTAAATKQIFENSSGLFHIETSSE